MEDASNPSQITVNAPQPKPDFDDIALGGISLRGLLTSVLVGAVIALTGFKVIPPETLVAMALTSFGVYFGKTSK